MKLSKLQKFILLECWYQKGKKVPRREFLRFYENYKRKVEMEDATNVITKSLLRLVRKNFIVGFGEITNQKTYIKFIRLTREGRKELKKMLDRQQRLPLRVKKSLGGLKSFICQLLF